MNWYSVLQSVITWTLTTFAFACFVWAAKTSKRITKLEEHDVVQAGQLQKLDTIMDKQVEINTKMDLLLQGKLNISVPAGCHTPA